MDRREFLKHTGLGAASLGLLGAAALPAAAADNQARRLTILHTNDMHSRIEPFPGNAAQWAGLGGMARRAALVEQVRRQEANVLLLDSGDIWQGTPYFNFFQGELEFKLMTQMGYDASTLGNHDFDNGLEGLQKQLPHAGFPFLIANYDFTGTLLAGRFQPYQVFEKQGLRIGVFGLGIELAGLVADKNFGATTYLDPVATAKEIVAKLRGPERCDLVVCLSHLGYKYESAKIDDRKLAAQVGGIDLILGGHTHTFLEQPEPIDGPNGHRTLVNQVGWSGINIGRIDYTFARGARRPSVAAAQVLPVQTV
ncbi:bifunctional metallophosphatase/5'-nucleotidase [Hymenobacter weizhouensis]|uniref:bifunctional metallophosphatase/5'-nucleotidase n=1 Tax=Hymenobacter sp. YIM 151500-1 TaxID=2987689 RepID=UPI0022270ECD|nr:metallophosphatase [Hymenobacter sp. YIM 151500-1]UYZ63243.1 metallophosphatase [Hymenobacter sp. YIM 151500-1]